jgi:hypothetical protein
VPAIGLFGSTHAGQISKHYPLHKTLCPRDAPRDHKCTPPCMMFEWLGCDNHCRTQGCEILQKVTTVVAYDVPPNSAEFRIKFVQFVLEKRAPEDGGKMSFAQWQN